MSIEKGTANKKCMIRVLTTAKNHREDRSLNEKSLNKIIYQTKEVATGNLKLAMTS